MSLLGSIQVYSIEIDEWTELHLPCNDTFDYLVASSHHLYIITSSEGVFQFNTEKEKWSTCNTLFPVLCDSKTPDWIPYDFFTVRLTKFHVENAKKCIKCICEECVERWLQ